jgi:hypothetical protein
VAAFVPFCHILDEPSFSTTFPFAECLTMSGVGNDLPSAQDAAQQPNEDATERATGNPKNDGADNDENDVKAPESGIDYSRQSHFQRALSDMAFFYTGKQTPNVVLPAFLELAAGIDGMETGWDFLAKHAMFSKEGKKQKVESELSGLIRKKICDYIDSSPSYSTPEEKNAAKAKIEEGDKWNGSGARHFRSVRYFAHICRHDKKKMIDKHGERANVPFTNSNCWFYLAIRERCNGRNTFNAMYEYSLLWEYDKHNDKKNITLEYLKAERKVDNELKKREKEKAARRARRASGAAAPRAWRASAARRASGAAAPPTTNDRQVPATDASTRAPATTLQTDSGRELELLLRDPCKPGDRPHLTIVNAVAAAGAHCVQYNDETGKHEYGPYGAGKFIVSFLPPFADCHVRVLMSCLRVLSSLAFFCRKLEQPSALQTVSTCHTKTKNTSRTSQKSSPLSEAI